VFDLLQITAAQCAHIAEYLLALKWWDWDTDKIFRNMGALCSGDLEQIKHIVD